MKTWTQAELDELIACPKQVVDPPRKTMRSERGHQRNDATLSSLDGERRFSVFMRINEDFPENFTVGLVYHPSDEPGELHLLRCNGPHGAYANASLEDPPPHFNFHIHRAQADLINAGLQSLKFAASTDAYASFREALQHFLKVVNIVDSEVHFPMVSQLPLFPDDGGQP